MIKIYDRLWYVTKEGEGTDLSYMCQYEETKSGGVASNVANMQRTGRNWARHGVKKEEVIDNTPTAGIYIGNSVSRWSTSNKLFRVIDPRGFTVEIPTDNIATLLHLTTVTNGVVQEKCVWGREGSNHILLPVNSEPYLLSLEQQNTLDNELIPISEIKRGDWVKVFGLDFEYYYAGRVKLTWNLRDYKSATYSYWRRDSSPAFYGDWHEVEDKKYVDLFLRKRGGKKSSVWYMDSSTPPKITKVLRNENIEIDVGDISGIYCPNRVRNILVDLLGRDYSQIECNLLSMKHKPT